MKFGNARSTTRLCRQLERPHSTRFAVIDAFADFKGFQLECERDIRRPKRHVRWVLAQDWIA
jgi:hypothetical protein